MTAAKHPPDVRVRATASLLVGERPAAVARDLGVPEGTVRSWKHRIKNGDGATLKKGELGGLLLEYLEASLRSLTAQSQRLADPEVLEGIPAGELAVLSGTIFDRTMRALELSGTVLGDAGERWGEGGGR